MKPSLPSIVVMLILLVSAIGWTAHAHAQTSSQVFDASRPGTDGSIAALKQEIDALSTKVEASDVDFKTLLLFRQQADGLVHRADALVAKGPLGSPVPPSTGEGTTKATPAKAIMKSADALRERITDLRRRQLTGRLYVATLSPFSPSFWTDIITLAVPTTRDQLVELRDFWAEHSANELLLDTGLMAVSLAVIIVFVVLARRHIRARILGRLAADANGVLDRRTLYLRALVSLILSNLPIPIALGLLAFIDRQINFAPDELDPFFVSAILVWAGVSIGISTLQIALQPHRADLRLLTLTDRQSLIFFRSGTILMLVYGGAIALNEFESALHILVAISAATTMIWVSVCSICIAWTLQALRHERVPRIDATDGGPVDQFGALVVAPTRRDRIALISLHVVGWSVLIVCTFGVLAGYLALAGFTMGRFIVTIVLWTLASVLLKSVDVLLTPQRRQELARKPVPSALTGPVSETEGLVVAVIAGVLRVAVILPMVFVTIGPWHLEYGEINPFQDAFVGINLVELRDTIGALGFATICLAIGLIATKILTAWLDASLLPYTRLDFGVRYSLTTIVSYGGIALSIALALSQLGVSPQSLTVIASALSIGIGFGLQSIVSNFVSGLILLTERRVRIGDLVTVKGEEGRVKQINVRSTVITTGENVDLIVPNVDLITTIVRNKTLTEPRIKVRMPLIVAHDSDLQGLFDAVMGATYDHENVDLEPPPTITLTKPSPIGLEFEVTFLTVDDSIAARTKSELYLHWIELLRDRGIALAQSKAI